MSSPPIPNSHPGGQGSGSSVQKVQRQPRRAASGGEEGHPPLLARRRRTAGDGDAAALGVPGAAKARVTVAVRSVAVHFPHRWEEGGLRGGACHRVQARGAVDAVKGNTSRRRRAGHQEQRPLRVPRNAQGHAARTQRRSLPRLGIPQRQGAVPAGGGTRVRAHSRRSRRPPPDARGGAGQEEAGGGVGELDCGAGPGVGQGDAALVVGVPHAGDAVVGSRSRQERAAGRPGQGGDGGAGRVLQERHPRRWAAAPPMDSPQTDAALAANRDRGMSACRLPGNAGGVAHKLVAQLELVPLPRARRRVIERNCKLPLAPLPSLAAGRCQGGHN